MDRWRVTLLLIAIVGGCYWLQLSDGDSYQPYMVATELNNKTIANGEIEQYSIICLDKYVWNKLTI